jgi:hypothetical protein
VKTGARGKNIPAGSYYGYASGILGLRLFPNPDFDAAAEKKWDPYRYYNDPSYYEDKSLIRPYRVGMSCAFCHVGPNPIKPPADPNHPKWENLSSNVGAQYFWIERRDQLHLSALPHLAARHARYVADLDGQHQQSPDDECRLSSAAPACGGQALGQGDAGRRPAQ